MIDWLTLTISHDEISEETRAYFDSLSDMIIRIDNDGQEVWRTSAAVPLRSDSHGLTLKSGTNGVTLMGSPARITQNNNIFGKRCVVECAHDMINFVQNHTGHALPLDLNLWKCTRIDVTLNHIMDSEEDVKYALEEMANANGGRFRVMNHGSTVYWNKTSQHLSGKAYAKGAHVRHMIKKTSRQLNRKALEGKDTARERASLFSATHEEIFVSNHILRLELKLGNKKMRQLDKPWHHLTIEELEQMNVIYFEKIIGNEIKKTITEDNIVSELVNSGLTERQAKAARTTWVMIQKTSYDWVYNNMSRATFYRHKKQLEKIGFGLADFQSGKITNIASQLPSHLKKESKPIIICEPVHTLHEALNKLQA
ncbi:MAG: phage/plasmid replication protein, II/X family [Kangiellaceae bacterium]|jgi:II/X family phage/plasmid replication protein|nr:phage/plasmid replication protein, II/X family [Kangiellaceae bacterium]